MLVRCSSCKNKCWQINQGIEWCSKNQEHFNIENGDACCPDYEKREEGITSYNSCIEDYKKEIIEQSKKITELTQKSIDCKLEIKRLKEENKELNTILEFKQNYADLFIKPQAVNKFIENVKFYLEELCAEKAGQDLEDIPFVRTYDLCNTVNKVYKQMFEEDYLTDIAKNILEEHKEAFEKLSEKQE